MQPKDDFKCGGFFFFKVTKNKGQTTSCRHWGAPYWAPLGTRLLNSPDKSLGKGEYNKSNVKIASSLMGPVF